MNQSSNKVKWYPRLFTDDMVREILSGRKTATRWPLRKQPVEDVTKRKGKWVWEDVDGNIFRAPVRPGDVIWVREAWVELTAVSPATDEPIPVGSGEQLIEPPTFYMDRKGEKRWNYDGTVIAYRANSDVEFCDGDGFSGEMADKGDLPHWRPSIHMPRKYARLFGRVSDVKLFRLCRELELARKRTLPRALEWTNEPHPGAYNWWRDEYGCIPRYVYQDGTVAITMLMVRVPYQDLGGQWAGPIPEPREPKESVCPGK